ncbi:MAG: hypothetical protein LH647_19095, partial [Leptolyngbyaceae cyanobacterium CAN_BIN12]|nr:hypothetical protein [Leptolyngbyaceae cyanobacterium CAN_BIN12]
MLTESKPLAIALKTERLNSNDRLFLNDSNFIYQIQSGAVDLFALYQGRRRYLFTVKSGELLFPIATSESISTCQLFVQATQVTTLEPLTQAGFQDWIREHPHIAIAGLETWVTALSNSVSNLLTAVLPTPIPSSGILDRHEVFQPPQGQVSWIRLYQGEANLLGCQDLTITPEWEWFPITGSLWFQATHLVELERCHHTALTQPQMFLQGVLQLQQLLGQLLATQLQQVQREELERLHLREQINQEALTKTNAEFTALFQP